MSLKNDMIKILKDLKHPFGDPNEEHLITSRQLLALKNVLTLAHERIWLGESHPNRPTYHIEYDESISDEALNNARESVEVVELLFQTERNRLADKR
tara:strand:+ start:1008 stop:1298 length:291 start_codon:yes stop_codon:yes gene_type:complete